MLGDLTFLESSQVPLVQLGPFIRIAGWFPKVGLHLTNLLQHYCKWNHWRETAEGCFVSWERGAILFVGKSSSMGVFFSFFDCLVFLFSSIGSETNLTGSIFFHCFIKEKPSLALSLSWIPNLFASAELAVNWFWGDLRAGKEQRCRLIWFSLGSPSFGYSFWEHFATVRDPSYLAHKRDWTHQTLPRKAIQSSLNHFANVILKTSEDGVWKSPRWRRWRMAWQMGMVAIHMLVRFVVINKTKILIIQDSVPTCASL